MEPPTRREFLGLSAALFVAACGDDERMPMPGTPPWHMWGDTGVLESTINALGVTTIVGQAQFARINYRRPETWSFFLFAELTSGPVPAVNPAQLFVRIDLSHGIGRSMHQTQGREGSVNESFAFFRFNVPLGQQPGNQAANRKYVTSVQSPLTDDLVATSSRIIDWIPAQDIQVSARLQIEGTTDPGTYRAKVGAFFAPRSHIRPDWFADGPRATQFRGDETGGA